MTPADEILLHALRASHVLWLLGLASLLHWRLFVPRLRPGGGRRLHDALRVSVVLPMRDEERNAEGCLRALLGQRYPDYEVLAVDDESADRTAEIAAEIAREDSRLTLLTGAPLPCGWTGKAWASHQAARRASGEWLLFTDADVRLHPDALASAVAVAASRRAEMLSVVQRLECETFWERVLQPAFAAFVLAVSPARLAQSPRLGVAYATGQFILVRRDAYESAGGFGAVRGEVTEDVAFARLLKRRGCRLVMANAADVVRVRMYHGFGEVWRGWRKGLYPASGHSGPLMAVALLLIGLTSVLPALTLLGWFAGLDGPVIGAAAVSVLLMLATRFVGDSLFGVSPAYGVFQPLAALVIAANWLASMRRHHTGLGQVWKGRTYGGR